MSECARMVLKHLPVSASHILMVLSLLAVNICVPSGEKLALRTSFLCPFNVNKQSPVSVLQTFAVMSEEPVTSGGLCERTMSTVAPSLRPAFATVSASFSSCDPTKILMVCAPPAPSAAPAAANLRRSTPTVSLSFTCTVGNESPVAANRALIFQGSRSSMNTRLRAPGASACRLPDELPQPPIAKTSTHSAPKITLAGL
mmetsp:Transcript_84955/g.155831  ORF Transcript_84955/g.155831 Transcript_84955/m.155831 type:complete len:200 (-) Transcript_84955:7-606(-)